MPRQYPLMPIDRGRSQPSNSTFPIHPWDLPHSPLGLSPIPAASGALLLPPPSDTSWYLSNPSPLFLGPHPPRPASPEHIRDHPWSISKTTRKHIKDHPWSISKTTPKHIRGHPEAYRKPPGSISGATPKHIENHPEAYQGPPRTYQGPPRSSQLTV